ncbi:phage tail tape measure protein [Agrococcus sp. DT81.2]|uniref:phage tail tape measure protein n=1 Tax=Agrococcus sp. DT81.2 TaxID=3393414 RepID=UPI003CE5703C
MADRTVSVKLIADAKQYIQGLDEAARKTRDASQTVEQGLAAQRDAFNQVGAAATTVGVLALAGVTAAVAAFAQFDAAMSGVQAATHESAENMQLLSDAALEAGQRTVFSATESAAAIENLARAGISTADVLGGALDGALDLAAAGEIEVADAAEIAASAMTQFGKSGSDVTHIADLLAAGAGKAQGGVADLAAGLNQSGLVAAQMGLSIEETVGSLTAFASAGLIGSDAGTSFRSMLLRLANPTKESAALMDELGLSFYNAQGDFIGVEGMAGQLQERLADLTQEQRNQALAQIFGQDAIRTSAILYEQGAEGVREWTEAVDEQGYAAETAALRLDNLKGDIEQLGGAFETLMINLGAAGDGPLRGMTQSLTGIVEMLGDMDPVAQSALLGLGALVGVVGLVGGAALLAVPKIAEFRVALGTLGVSAGVASGALTALSVAGVAGLAIGGLVALGIAFENTRPKASEFSAAIQDGANAIDLLRLANEGFANTVDGFEFDVGNAGALLEQNTRLSENFFASFDPSNWEAYFSDFNSRITQVGEGLGDLAATDLNAAVEAFIHFGETLGYNDEQMAVLLESMPELRDAWAAASDEAGESVSVLGLVRDAQAGVGLTAEDAAEAVETVATAFGEATEEAASLYEATKAITDLFFSAQDAMSAFEQSIDDIAEAMTGEDALVPAIDAMTGGFDLGEQAGRDADAMLQALAENAQAAAEAMANNGKSAEEVAAFQDRARAEIERVAGSMKLAEDQARLYTDAIVDIPAEASTDVTLNTAAAEAALLAFITKRRVLAVDVDVNGMPSGTIVRPGQIGRFADGGRIPGYAPGYDDRLGFLSNGSVVGLGGGEYIMPTRMTDKYLDILEQMRVGAFPGYASGGRVAMPSQSPSFRPVINVAAPAPAGGGAQVQIDVRPAPGMSEAAFADKAAAAFGWALR